MSQLPIVFHFSEKTSVRIMRHLPRDRETTLTDVCLALEKLADEDAKNILQNPLTASRAAGT